MNDQFTTQHSSEQPFALVRRGVVLRPDKNNPHESGGVLNPAAALRNGTTFVFYRAVAEQPVNFSRILIASCRLDDAGMITTERLSKVALEPEVEYELWEDGEGGGVEDPRITEIDNVYYMTYTAYGVVDGEIQPRIALAQSDDLFNWRRMGLAHFAPFAATTDQATLGDLNATPNKDAILFPQRINDRYCLLHRPMFAPESGQQQSIWLSSSDDLLNWDNHQLVLAPTLAWESLKVGGGTNPLLTPFGWLTFYHGVEGKADSDPNRKYHAGALVLATDDPARIVYRSPEPVLSPGTVDEQVGVVSNVVFPTGLVQQPDGRIDVYYGMADQAIGLATTFLPTNTDWLEQTAQQDGAASPHRG